MRRYGFVGIIIRNREASAAKIQEILSRHAAVIQGRLGLPHLDANRVAVIALIIYATSEELGAMAGQLGRLPGVVVKSALEPMGEVQP